MTSMNECLSWKKSTYSEASGVCVEVAGLPGAMLVRDSKHPDGSMLSVRDPAWSVFVASVRTGHFA